MTNYLVVQPTHKAAYLGPGSMLRPGRAAKGARACFISPLPGDFDGFLFPACLPCRCCLPLLSALWSSSGA